jgi:hypothetical protein
MRQGIPQYGTNIWHNSRIWRAKIRNRAQHIVHYKSTFVRESHWQSTQCKENLGAYRGPRQFYIKRVWDSYLLGAILLLLSKGFFSQKLWVS